MALIVPADIDSWIGKSISAERQDELVDCISYAQSWVAKAAGIRSLEKEVSAVTTYIDGSDACGDDLYLPADIRPAWHANTPDAMTVSEDGASLTVSAVFSKTAAVIIENANTQRRIKLTRSGGWSSTWPKNIAVSCKVGFTWNPDAAILPVPHYVRRLLMEVAWLQFNSSSWVGHANVSKAGTAVSIENDLSPAAKDGLELLRGV